MLTLSHLTKSFKGIRALSDVSFSVEQGEIVGLIGPNGSGKSTLFNLIMNVLEKDGGHVCLDDFDISDLETYQIAKLGIVRTFQDARPLPQITVKENLQVAFPRKISISLKNIFFSRKLIKAQHLSNNHKIRDLLKSVNLKSKEKTFATHLSYGQAKLLEILKVMAADGKIILLDEPFSGLYGEMIKLISAKIKQLTQEGKTIILIEHNMKLIEEICDRVIVLDSGKKIAEGIFSEIKKDKIVIESYLGK